MLTHSCAHYSTRSSVADGIPHAAALRCPDRQPERGPDDTEPDGARPHAASYRATDAAAQFIPHRGPDRDTDRCTYRDSQYVAIRHYTID